MARTIRDVTGENFYPHTRRDVYLYGKFLAPGEKDSDQLRNWNLWLALVDRARNRIIKYHIYIYT